MYDAIDIEDKCTKTGRASNSPLSPISSLTEAFQRLKIGEDTLAGEDILAGEDTLALRSNRAVAAIRRKRKPTPYILRQSLEQRPYARVKPLEIVPSLVRYNMITFFTNYFETALDS